MDCFLRTIILSVERDYILKNKRQRRDHIRTVRREMVLELDKIGAKFMISYDDKPAIIELYDKFTILIHAFHN